MSFDSTLCMCGGSERDHFRKQCPLKPKVVDSLTLRTGERNNSEQGMLPQSGDNHAHTHVGRYVLYVQRWPALYCPPLPHSSSHGSVSVGVQWVCVSCCTHRGQRRKESG